MSERNDYLTRLRERLLPPDIDEAAAFCNAVENLVQSIPGMRYLDAILTVCADSRECGLGYQCKIEPEVAAAYLNPDIKEKLTAELASAPRMSFATAQELGLL